MWRWSYSGFSQCNYFGGLYHHKDGVWMYITITIVQLIYYMSSWYICLLMLQFYLDKKRFASIIYLINTNLFHYRFSLQQRQLMENVEYFLHSLKELTRGTFLNFHLWSKSVLTECSPRFCIWLLSGTQVEGLQILNLERFISVILASCPILVPYGFLWLKYSFCISKQFLFK